MRIFWTHDLQKVSSRAKLFDGCHKEILHAYVEYRMMLKYRLNSPFAKQNRDT